MTLREENKEMGERAVLQDLATVLMSQDCEVPKFQHHAIESVTHDYPMVSSRGKDSGDQSFFYSSD